MKPDDSDKSLGDGGTFAGDQEHERAAMSLGDEATFAGAARRRVADASLGDERTLGGEAAAGLDTVIDDIEIVDLQARYKPEGTLGRGGMGEVLLALDTRLGRKVAIKRILGEAARSKTAVSRFLIEAKAIAAISHPNVVQIYDYGRAKDGPFLIMEYVDGSSLLDRCRDGALPLEEAVDLACQLCDGLAKAHDLGIVHRDIKPANVLLTKDGLPKLTDFGLAKAEAADHQMTMTGAVLGTPDFMPPEQRRDAALVDARSDLWSLAATLYQMVTGRSPKIIRFDLLPAVLTEVLGKALEEAKEDRFQTARELRDALKASLVAAAPAVAELGEGQCPACGVKNDSSRRFCRGCGESLEAPCLSCAKPMPMWEEICGQCGTKQAPLLETRRGEMAAQQAEAEGLLKEYGFEHAEQITVTLRDEADPRLKQLTPWATAFLPKIAAARDAQLSQAVAALIEALKHEASFDYPSAIHALEQVPEILRSRPLGGQAETVAAVLARVATKQAEVERLESLVKARIAAKELGGLLTEVRKLQGLRPDRADVDKLCTQLEERQQKLVVHRDEALKLAQAHFDAKDYESVIAVLRKVDRSVETPEVGRLRDAANVNIKCLQDLMREISQAVSLKQLDGLMPKVQAALSLRPGHPELLKLLDNLQSREQKVAAGIKDVVSQADEAFKACRFDKAVALLHRIPENRRNSDVTDLLDRSEYLAMTRAGVISGFEGLPKGADLAEADGLDLSGLATRGRSYLGQIATHGLADPAIEQWCVRCEAAAERREAAEEAERLAKANLRRVLVGAGLAMAVVVLLVAGFMVQSSWRLANIQAALRQQDWQEALKQDPDNVSALVGLARKHLGEQPPDIDRAFADLDRAERVAPGSEDIKMTRAAAYVARALENVAKTQLDDASKSLSDAERLTKANNVLHPARHALAMAWVARSIQFARVDKLDEAYDAIRQAQRYADEQSSVKPAEEAIYDARVMRIEKYALAGRLTEAEKELEEARGLLPERDLSKAESLLANSWIREGEAAIAEGDFQAALRACVEARKYGAAESRLDSLVADAVFQQAAALLGAGDSKQAVSKVNEALARNESAVLKALKDPKSDALRVAVIQDYRRQVELAWERGDHEAAIALVTRAVAVDPKAGEWLGEILADKRGALSSIPEKVIARLPPRSLVLLPASEFQKLTPSAVAVLPRDVVANIPLGVLSGFSSDAMVRLPSLYNSIGMELRLLPPGKFRSNEEARTVTLSRPYLIGATEVTNEQWKRVMGDTTSYWKEDNLPVNGCSWEEASEFCRKLSALVEERAANRRYRLPTEAEWEYACRAGTTTRFSFGDDEAQLVDYAWCEANSGEQVHPVRQKKPNSWGLYDMHGNVWEWCSDWHADHPSRDETNPTGPATGYERVFRGGCWIYGAGACASSLRPGLDPSPSHYGRLGFRVVLEVP